MKSRVLCLLVFGMTMTASADELTDGIAKTKSYQQFVAAKKCSPTVVAAELGTDNGNRGGTSIYIGMASCGKSIRDDRLVALFSSTWQSGKASLEIQEIPSKIDSVVKLALNQNYSCQGIEPQKGNRWIKAYRSNTPTNSNFSFYKDDIYSVSTDIYLDQEACEKGKGSVSWATSSCTDEVGATIQGPCCCIGG